MKAVVPTPGLLRRGLGGGGGILASVGFIQAVAYGASNYPACLFNIDLQGLASRRGVLCFAGPCPAIKQG